jgi:hypothetical protein
LGEYAGGTYLLYEPNPGDFFLTSSIGLGESVVGKIGYENHFFTNQGFLE